MLAVPKYHSRAVNLHPQTVRTAIDWLLGAGWLKELKKPKAGVGGQGRCELMNDAD